MTAPGRGREPAGRGDREPTTPRKRTARTGAGAWILLGGAAALAGCSEHKFDPPDPDARVAQAAEAFSPSLFDSIQWEADSIRAFDGNVVYATYCRNCHGPLGAGGTDYARNRGLEVPSLVEPDWSMAESPDSILYRIFVGHAAGMPNWGVAGISPREMDAVAFYLTEVLRPEVLSER